MDIEDLLTLKIFLQSEDGEVFRIFISDFITAEACKNIDPYELKGMCRLFEKIKRLPEELEKLNKRSN